MITIEINSQADFNAIRDESGNVFVAANIKLNVSIYTSGGSIYTSGGSIDTSGGSIYTSGGSIDTGGGNIDTSGGSIYIASIYGIICGGLICGLVAPSSGAADRSLWAARFGIDTTTGCYTEWAERLKAVADDLLLDEKRWLPIELLYIKSARGDFLK